MSQEHYNAVRKSDLYEYGNVRKPLLTLIAGLIIAPPEEDEQGKPKFEPDPDAGWCVARQDYLAAAVGCSVEQVSRLTGEFEADGWLTIKKFHDEYGHPRCHYTMTQKQLEAIKTREMKKDADGKYIRAEKPANSRKEKSRENLIWKRKVTKKMEQPLDGPSKSPLTSRQEATCPTVKNPLDGPSISVVPSFFNPVVETTSPSEKPKNGTLSLSDKEGKKSQEGAVAIAPAPAVKTVEDSAAPRPAMRVILTPFVVERLKAFGCPDKVLDMLELHTKIADTLNGNGTGGCSNPVAAYATIAAKNPKFGKLWMPVIKADTETGTSLSAVEAKVADAKRSPKEKAAEAALHWWGRKSIEERRASGVRYTYDKALEAELPSEDDIVELYLREMETGNDSEARMWRKRRDARLAETRAVLERTAASVQRNKERRAQRLRRDAMLEADDKDVRAWVRSEVYDPEETSTADQ